jgi:SH3-like domain-containing protein
VEGYRLENTSGSYTPIEDMASYKYNLIYLELVPSPAYAVLFIFVTNGNVILIVIIT